MDSKQKWEIIKSLDNDIVAKAKYNHIPGMEWKDIADELRIKLYYALDQFNKDISGVRTFCVKVMDNKIKDMFRFESRRLLNKCYPLLGDPPDNKENE